MVEVAGAFTAKSGKHFSVLKMSDLVKYDMSKVKKLLETNAQNNQGTKEEQVEFVKISEKSFNSNGYKTLKVMAF